MFKFNEAQYFPKVAQNVLKLDFTHKVTFFKVAQKVAKYLGDVFCPK